MEDAFNFVQSKRPIVQPNTGFIKALLKFEHEDPAFTSVCHSTNFLAAYVGNTMMGPKFLEQIPVAEFQAIIDECDGDVPKAQLKAMQVLSDLKGK